jgi:sacsin
MRALSELTASGGRPEESVEQILSLHESISPAVTKLLGLPTFTDRILQALNDPSFELDFSQTESPKAVIRDTLQRYSLESTFSEYLANADDCGTAREICWILDSSDDGVSSGSGLISSKLSAIQGPALFCCNDGGEFPGPRCHEPGKLGNA